MKKPIVLTLAGITLLALVAVSALWPQEYRRVPSPDGKHIAIAKYRAYEGWLPRMPGGSGDKSGWLIVVTKDGTRVGEAVLGMVSDIETLSWEKGSVWIPGHGEVKL